MNNIKPEWVEKAARSLAEEHNEEFDDLMDDFKEEWRAAARIVLKSVLVDIAAHAVESAGLALLCDDDAYVETALGGVDYVQEWLHERAEKIRSNDGSTD